MTGELFIGGDGVARGYLNRPELSAERFIPDPFRPDAQARLYRTGDSVRYRVDGCVEFLGRVDHQVKVRGHRIELGEIESVLAQHPEIRDQVVVARADASGENRLVAYIVPRNGSAPGPSALRAFLQQKLPAYMIPAAFVVLDALPLTANNKVDRKALPDPGATSGSRPRSDDAPMTEVEQKLATIWAKSLGLERVGLHDNFFELGGHSLMATGLFMRIEAEFGRVIPLATLFRAQTVAELAAVLNEAPDLNPEPRTLVIRRGDPHRPPLFLVHSLSGDLMVWRTLIGALDADLPVHGLTLPTKNGVLEPFPDIEALAAYHVEQICAAKSEGPYHIAGFSFGATVALEIAQQLTASGPRSDCSRRSIPGQGPCAKRAAVRFASWLAFAQGLLLVYR